MEDNNNGKGTPAPMDQSQGGVRPVVTHGWKAYLPVDYRKRIIKKMFETFRKHLPFSGQEGLRELLKIVIRFENRTYVSATSQSDYLRKISLKILNMETKVNAANPSADASWASSDLGNREIQSPLAIVFMNHNKLRGAQVPIGQPQGSVVEQSALSSSDSAPPMDPNVQRAQLPLDSRLRTESLKKQFPLSGQEQERLQEIKKIVLGFEEKTSKIYSDASSQSDYLREMPLKIHIMDTKSQSPTVNSLETNASRNKRMRRESAIGVMDGNNLRGAQVPMGQPQGSAVKQSDLSNSDDTPPVDPNDWRAQLLPDDRQRIVNKIWKTLKTHLSFPGLQQEEALQEVKKMAVEFEVKMYSVATSQSDYLRQISVKMVNLETNPTASTNFMM